MKNNAWGRSQYEYNLLKGAIPVPVQLFKECMSWEHKHSFSIFRS